MNEVRFSGRLTRDPVIKRTIGQDGQERVTARYILAVRRNYKNENGEYSVDFPSLFATGHRAEFVQKYLKQGTYIIEIGRAHV